MTGHSCVLSELAGSCQGREVLHPSGKSKWSSDPDSVAIGRIFHDHHGLVTARSTKLLSAPK